MLGGWGGIRTHETVARLPVFKTGAFNHSATHPTRNFLADSGRPGLRLGQTATRLLPRVPTHDAVRTRGVRRCVQGTHGLPVGNAVMATSQAERTRPRYRAIS